MTTTLVVRDDADDADEALADTNPTDALAECEDQIEQAKRDILVSWAEIGRALKQVHDARLYKAGGFDRFEDWSKERFGLSKSHAYRLIEAATALADIAARLGEGNGGEVGDVSSPGSSVIPEAVLRTEHHARALLPLWRSNPESAVEVVQGLATAGGEPTSTDIAEVVASKSDGASQSEGTLRGTFGTGASPGYAGESYISPVESGSDPFPRGIGSGLDAPHEDDVPGPAALVVEEPVDASDVDSAAVAQALVEAGYALLGRAGQGGEQVASSLPFTLSLPFDGGSIEVSVRLCLSLQEDVPASSDDVPADTPLFACPRCGTMSDTRLYGVCPTCVESLRVAGMESDESDAF